MEGWPSGSRRRPAKALGSKGPRGFESHSLRLPLEGLVPRADGCVQDGWPSGLRRTIGNRVGASPRGFESHPVRCRWFGKYGAWLSPVERCVRDAEVPGSNPGAPIGMEEGRRSPNW